MDEATLQPYVQVARAAYPAPFHRGGRGRGGRLGQDAFRFTLLGVQDDIGQNGTLVLYRPKDAQFSYVPVHRCRFRKTFDVSKLTSVICELVLADRSFMKSVNDANPKFKTEKIDQIRPVYVAEMFKKRFRPELIEEVLGLLTFDEQVAATPVKLMQELRRGFANVGSNFKPELPKANGNVVFPSAVEVDWVTTECNLGYISMWQHSVTSLHDSKKQQREQAKAGPVVDPEVEHLTYLNETWEVRPYLGKYVFQSAQRIQEITKDQYQLIKADSVNQMVDVDKSLHELLYTDFKNRLLAHSHHPYMQDWAKNKLIPAATNNHGVGFSECLERYRLDVQLLASKKTASKVSRFLRRKCPDWDVPENDSALEVINDALSVRNTLVIKMLRSLEAKSDSSVTSQSACPHNYRTPLTGTNLSSRDERSLDKRFSKKF